MAIDLKLTELISMTLPEEWTVIVSEEQSQKPQQPPILFAATVFIAPDAVRSPKGLLEAHMICVEDDSDAHSEVMLFDMHSRQHRIFESLMRNSDDAIDPMLRMKGSWGGCDDEVKLGGLNWQELHYDRSLSSADLKTLRRITGCTELHWLLRVRQVQNYMVSVHSIGPDETLKDRALEINPIFESIGRLN